MFKISLELFTIGLALGLGPCLSFCLPLLLPYIAGTKGDWREGLKITLFFSLSRILAYLVLGFIAGLSGELINRLFHFGNFPFYIMIASGILITFLGFLTLLGKSPSSSLCRVMRRYAVDNDAGSIMLLGFMIGLTPCAPLLGILTYIIVFSPSPLLGMYYTLCFGIGTVISPLIPLGTLASFLPRAMLKDMRLYDLFGRFCGALLIFFGIRLIASQIL